MSALMVKSPVIVLAVLWAVMARSQAAPNPPTNLRIAGAAATQQNVPSPDPAGIFDGKGNFNSVAYVAAVKGFGTASMIPEKFGNAWSSYHATVTAPTWSQAASIRFSGTSNPSEFFYYSRGARCSEPGDYGGSYGQVGYITDPAVPASTPGVDGILTLAKAYCLWAGQPQRYWSTSGHPTKMLFPSIVAQYDPYGMPKQLIEVTRAYGASESAACSYMVFQGGQIACGEGGNTGEDHYYFKPFPSNFAPTAASVTNNGEFLLVTGWNTDTHQGQLAVLAMGGFKATGQFWNYEWTETYPGFRNYSLPTFSKLLGIIDLPEMAAPTAVEAVGNWVIDANGWIPGNKIPGDFPLSNQANWQCFAAGACSKLYDTAGFALVASRYERKVLLVDLGPLFQMISKGMFSSWATFRANVAATATNQWPPTFVEQPTAAPAVVKTMDFDSHVTAISASLYADNQAFIATEDGTLHVWDVDGLQTATGKGANAAEVTTLKIGRNVTRIAHMKHQQLSPIKNSIRYQYILLSRGDKTVVWVDMSSGTPRILHTLGDSRLVDPISVEDNNNHGTYSDLIDIADYGDKNVKGYRYGPVILNDPSRPTFGMGPGGSDPFEYEGAYATPTGPFTISITNIP